MSETKTRIEGQPLPEGFRPDDGRQCMLVALDLRAPMDYFPLFRLLEGEESARILPHLWAVRTANTPAELRDRLWACIHPDDGILVLRSGREAAWFDVDCDDQWLRDNL